MRIFEGIVKDNGDDGAQRILEVDASFFNVDGFPDNYNAAAAFYKNSVPIPFFKELSLVVPNGHSLESWVLMCGQPKLLKVSLWQIISCYPSP